MSFRVAEGYVEVTADRKKYDAEISKLKGQKLDIAALVKLDDAAARAALVKLARPLTVKVSAQLDDTAAKAKLKALTKNAAARVTVTVADAGAKTSLTQLGKPIAAKLAVTVDDTATKARLAALKKPLPVKATVSVADTAAKTALARLARAFTITATVRVVDTLAKSKLAALGKDVTVQAAVALNDTAARTGVDRLARDVNAKLKVLVDDTDAKARLKALGAAAKAQIKAELAPASVASVEKQILKLIRDRIIKIVAVLEATTYLAALDRLTRDQFVQVTPRLKADTYIGQLDRLTRDRNIDIRAQLVTGDAGTRLDALSRNRRVRIDVDMDRQSLGGLSNGLRNAGTSGSTGSAGIGSFLSATRLLWTTAATSIPTLASLGQAIIAMAPAAGVAAPAILGLASAVAAIKLGTVGIGDAFKAAFDPANNSASAAASSARQLAGAQEAVARAAQAVKDAEVAAAAARVKAARDIQDAQESLQNTVQEVADAQRHAAESVANAERDLVRAQRDERQAQLDLNTARKEAKQALEDLSNQLADAQLNERDAQLAVEDATKNLQAVKLQGWSQDSEVYKKAQLAYDQAQQRLAEQETATQRLADEKATADANGVEGSTAVKTAQQQVTDAQESTRDKTIALQEAQIAAAEAQQAGAQKLAHAQRDVADAQQAAVKAQVDGARSIADAQQGVIDAMRSLADAQDSANSGANKLADAMARLSPNARDFMQAVIALGPAWRAVRVDVQDALFKGLGDTLTTMSQAVLPAVRQGLSGTATVLHDVAVNAMGAITQLGKSGTLTRVFAGINEGLAPLARIPGQIVTGLAQLSVAAAPAFTNLTAQASTAVDKIAAKLSHAFDSGSLQSTISGAVDLVKQFGRLLGDILGTVNNVMKAAAAGGGDALGALGAVFKELRAITAMPEMQAALTSIFRAMAAVGSLIGGTFGAVLKALLPLLAAIAPVVTGLAEQLGPVLAQLAGALGTALMPIVQALLPVISLVGAGLISIVQSLMPLLAPISALITQIIAALIPVLRPVIEIIVGVVAQLAGPLQSVIAALVPVVAMLGGIFAQVFGAIAPVLTPLLGIVGQLGRLIATVLGAALGAVMKAIQPLIPVFVQVVQILAQLLTAVLTPLAPVIGEVAGLLGQAFATAMTVLAPLIGQVAGLAMQLLPSFLPLIPVIAQLVQAVVQLMPPLLRLALEVVTPLIGTMAKFSQVVLSGVGWALKGLIPYIVEAIGWFVQIETTVIHIATSIIGWFQHLYDVLVGHSIIPDLVNEITRWFQNARDWAAAIFTGLMNDTVGIFDGIWSAVSAGWRAFSGYLASAVSSSVSWLTGAFWGAYHDVTGAWSALWSGLANTATSLWRGIQSGIDGFLNGVRNAFTWTKDALAGIWGDIRGIVADPIRFVVNTVYTGGIKRFWDTIADKVGMGHLPDIRLGFNKGGIVPGSGDRDTVPTMLTPGERILSNAQVDRLGGHRAIDAMVGRGTGRDGHFRGGGIIDTVTGALGGAADWAEGIVKGALGAVASKAADSLVRPLISRIPGKGDLGSLVKGVPSSALDSVLGFFKKDDQDYAKSAAAQMGNVSAALQGWIIQALATTQTPANWAGPLSVLVMRESGGNPNAINLWDSNAAQGYDMASKGLAQVIGPTFRSNHQDGTSSDIFDPVANLSAALNYIKRQYHDIFHVQQANPNLPPKGYDQGGLLAPGATLAVNSSGRPEAVLTADEHQAFRSIVANLSSGGSGVTIQNLEMKFSGLTLPNASERRQFAQAMVVEVKDALRDYDRGRAR